MNWPDQDTWRFINTFAPWLSALGTFAAVTLSLYLSMAGRRISLKVHASIFERLSNNGPPVSYIGVTVVNVGQPDANITNFAWQIGFPFFKTTLQPVSIDLMSSSIPIRLRNGDTAEFYIPLYNTEDHWAVKMKGHLGKYPKLMVLTMKVLVVTSSGKIVRKHVSDKIRNHLLETQVSKAV